MIFDQRGIRRGNFIVSKQEMKEYFSFFNDLSIIFGKPVVGKRYK